MAPAASVPPPGKRNAPERELVPVKYSIDAYFIAQHDAGDILDPVWWSGDIYGTLAEYEQSLHRFSREQRSFNALIWYRSEVGNGGHDQFFWNSTGIVWPDALAALEQLQLADGVAILKEAQRRMGGSPSLIRSERQERLDRLKPSFDDLDTRLYAFDAKVGLDRAMTAYIRANPKPFLFEGVVQVPRASLEARERIEKAFDAGFF